MNVTLKTLYSHFCYLERMYTLIYFGKNISKLKALKGYSESKGITTPIAISSSSNLTGSEFNEYKSSIQAVSQFEIIMSGANVQICNRTTC